MNAYVLIQSSVPGAATARTLRTISGVIAADDVTGAYDVIAVAQTDAARPLDTILQEIRSLVGVTRAIPARTLAPVAMGSPLAVAAAGRALQAA